MTNKYTKIQLELLKCFLLLETLNKSKFKSRKASLLGFLGWLSGQFFVAIPGYVRA